MSKFDYDSFYGGFDDFAVSKEKFTKDEAIALYKREMDIPSGETIAVMESYVRHRAGVNEDGEPCVGWWIEYAHYGRDCPCWVFHYPVINAENIEKDYEHIVVR